MRRFLITTFLASLLFGSSSLWAQDLTTIWDNGSSANRVDLVFVGDGYTASQIATDYSSHVSNTVGHLFNNSLSNPLPRYNKFFNVHRVNVISNESGADKPDDNIYVDTALDASFSWGGGPTRCLYFNTSKANTAVNNAIAGTSIDVDMKLGTVNTSQYGGCGGSWAVYSGANGSAFEVASHELGHSFAGLADEYFYSDDHYSGSEPNQWNVTADPNSGKWDRWVGYDDPDTDIGAIDYYEGGRYNATGIWRPSDNSKMRALGRAFDAISREKFISEIYDEVDPLDDWFGKNDIQGSNPETLWVSTVDTDVINVEWFVDDVSVGLLGESIDVDSLGLAPGEYTIEARAYDSILDHAFSGDSMDWWRLDSSHLEQRVSWLVVTSVPEPSASILLGLCALIAVRKRRRT